MKARNIDRLIDIMAQLRHPTDGCPWDVEQDFKSIAPYTIEEAYEVADAIERDDRDGLREELGDLLLQVVFHARMAEEEKSFDFEDVAGAIADKLVRRHPHVFDVENHDPDATLRDAWESQKAEERARKSETRGEEPSLLDDVPIALPSLTRAEKLQKRAARGGFDWASIGPVLEKIEEELGELRAEIDGRGSADQLADEMGDLLFSCVNLARHLKIDPEFALRGTNAKFENRFRHVEGSLRTDGRQMDKVSLDDLEALWQQAKTTAP
ncbi:MAG: nucleoside triphosphate pyrophosphohydrolase [Alphaproteobacteria bacterium]|nr:nucleoside triphosphate pyrophosphohydrolase [Alphaproteobacteria bacterium]|tara:strand:+ start:2180 stop:2983 length:804 start_codon:yes stop_codon:yes gene_type:complete